LFIHTKLHNSNTENRSNGRQLEQVLSSKNYSKVIRENGQYACNYCEQKFSSAGNLSNHEKLHLNLHQLCCGVCGRRYKLHHALREHLLLKHGRSTELLTNQELADGKYRMRYSSDSHRYRTLTVPHQQSTTKEVISIADNFELQCEKGSDFFIENECTEIIIQ